MCNWCLRIRDRNTMSRRHIRYSLCAVYLTWSVAFRDYEFKIYNSKISVILMQFERSLFVISTILCINKKIFFFYLKAKITTDRVSILICLIPYKFHLLIWLVYICLTLHKCSFCVQCYRLRWHLGTNFILVLKPWCFYSCVSANWWLRYINTWLCFLYAR